MHEFYFPSLHLPSTTEERAQKYTKKQMQLRSPRLILTTPPDLCLESTLDRIDRPSRAARLTGHEEDTVFLGEEGVGRLASLASDVFDCQKN